MSTITAVLVARLATELEMASLYLRAEPPLALDEVRRHLTAAETLVTQLREAS